MCVYVCVFLCVCARVQVLLYFLWRHYSRQQCKALNTLSNSLYHACNCMEMQDSREITSTYRSVRSLAVLCAVCRVPLYRSIIGQPITNPSLRDAASR